MKQHIVNHALSSFWCNPEQDRQVKFKLTRYTKAHGTIAYMDIDRCSEAMPTQNGYYHVYGIGQNNPSRINLSESIDVWHSASALCRGRNMTMDIYLNDGRLLPRNFVYFKRTRKQNLIIAIRRDFLKDDLSVQDVYIRFYSNAYYNSERDDHIAEKIVTIGKLVTTLEEQMEMQSDYHVLKSYNEGHVNMFLNGELVSDVLPEHFESGNLVEYFYDASIKDIHSWPLDSLQTFRSDLDNIQKFILHPPKDNDDVVFFDDVDFWLVVDGPNGSYRGRFIHTNQADHIRQLTHRDWSMSVRLINEYIEDMELMVTDNVRIVAHVRHSGYDRQLGFEHNRLHELYKLEDDQIINAFTGLNSVLNEWRASNLENSDLTKLMRSKYSDITPELAGKVLGYNALTKHLADGPIVFDDSVNNFIILPYGLIANSTIYEYSSDGLLVSWRDHTFGEHYYPTSPDCAFIEGIPGIGSMESGMLLSTSGPVTLQPDREYRFYVSPTHQNVPTQKWRDVTGDDEYYTIDENNVVNWHIDPLGLIGVAKHDFNFVCYDLTLQDTESVYDITINHDSAVDPWVLHIPPERVDIWMNGRFLVEGIDYVGHYPQFVITNREYLVPSQQEFTIRALGFCDQNMQRTLSNDRGFVRKQTISLNDIYDVRDDHVMRYIVDGKLRLKSTLSFSESMGTITMDYNENGRPYLAQDAIIPVRELVDFNTQPYRIESRDLDKRVSDYMGLYEAKPVNDNIDALPRRHKLYSPILARLINDLVRGYTFYVANNREESEVAKAMDNYLYLLKYDPTKLPLDADFVDIAPHPYPTAVKVTDEMYGYIARVNRVYLNNRIDLSSFLNIVPESEI